MDAGKGEERKKNETRARGAAKAKLGRLRRAFFFFFFSREDATVMRCVHAFPPSSEREGCGQRTIRVWCRRDVDVTPLKRHARPGGCWGSIFLSRPLSFFLLTFGYVHEKERTCHQEQQQRLLRPHLFVHSNPPCPPAPTLTVTPHPRLLQTHGAGDTLVSRVVAPPLELGAGACSKMWSVGDDVFKVKLNETKISPCTLQGPVWGRGAGPIACC